MACPLSALLNPRDITPLRIIDNSTTNADGNRHTSIDSNLIDIDSSSADQQQQQHSISSLASPPLSPTHPGPNRVPRGNCFDYEYPVILSNKRGALYSRRAARFADRGRHHDDILTPPRTDYLVSESQGFFGQLVSQNESFVRGESRIHPNPPGLSVRAKTPLTTTDDNLLRAPTPEVIFREFSIFQALHAHPELIFELTRHFDIEDLISVYAISKDFHDLVDARFTTMIRDQALARAPESAQVFRFGCYEHLCKPDPNMRPLTRISHQVRWVPGFRWLRMIVYRERVVDEIIKCLECEGLFLPAQKTSLALKKIWFTLDIGDTVRRLSIIHKQRFWTDDDLLLATTFFVKLDMRFTDPRTGTGSPLLRRMLLAQPGGLTPLLRALQRETLRSPLDVLRLHVRLQYRPAPRFAHFGILGIPAEKIGTMVYEGWGMRPRDLIDIESLIMGEGLRRQLGLEGQLVDMILYGFMDKNTFKDRWHPGAEMDEGENDGTESDGNGERNVGNAEAENETADGPSSPPHLLSSASLQPVTTASAAPVDIDMYADLDLDTNIDAETETNADADADAGLT